MRYVRWLLMAAIGGCMLSMVLLAYQTGYYVGDVAVRIEAQEAHAGWYNPWHGFQWEWLTHPLGPKYATYWHNDLRRERVDVNRGVQSLQIHKGTTATLDMESM